MPTALRGHGKARSPACPRKAVGMAPSEGEPRSRFLKLRSCRWFGGVAEPSELPGGGRIGYRGVDDISAARSLQEFTDDSPPVPAGAQDLLPPLAVVDLGAVAEPRDRRLPRAPRPHVGLASRRCHPHRGLPPRQRRPLPG